MSGDPGYEAKPVQSAGYGNAVPFVNGTPQTAGIGVLVSASVAGTVILTTRLGQSVTLQVPIGLTHVPLSCSELTGGTFTGTAYNCW